jgi:hypothetical protein
MTKLSIEAEMLSAIRENTSVLQRNIDETRKLSELLMPALKKTETLRFKKLQDQELLESCLKTVREGLA